MSTTPCTSPPVDPVNNTYNFPITVWQNEVTPCSVADLKVIRPIVISYVDNGDSTFNVTINYLVTGTIEAPGVTAVATLTSGPAGKLSNLSIPAFNQPGIPGINFALGNRLVKGVNVFGVSIDDISSGPYEITYAFAPNPPNPLTIDIVAAQNSIVSGSGVLSDPATSLSLMNSTNMMASSQAIRSDTMNTLSRLPKCNKCTPNACNDCQAFVTPGCNSVNVPIINLLALLSIGGADVAQAQFIICDEFTYYEEKPLPHDDRCVVAYIKPCQLKETKFLRCCPFMVSVVKGKGATLYDKLLSIYMQYSLSIGTDFFTFYYRVVLYGMSKYILSRILYGKFDINFLLNKFNKKFLEDLGHSRFCSFIAVFEDCTSVVFGYQKYFRFDKHHKSSSSK
jgi:hypothetical protein